MGNVESIYNNSFTKVAWYTYDAYGNYKADGAPVILAFNHFTYRGYYYDEDLGLYYLQTRYYDPTTARFINADRQLNGGLLGDNLFAYCANNPVNYVDPTGEAWWHWAIGAAIVATCAVATVATCGGFAAATTAVWLVGNGIAAATTASTVAASAFIGSATVYGISVISAACTSDSIQDFNDKGNWGTVVSTLFGMIGGAINGYMMSVETQRLANSTTGRGAQNPKISEAAKRGQEIHKQMDYGPGVYKEKTIAPGCRVDGIDYDKRIIYELKPNNPAAIARGMRQLDRYTKAAEQRYGGTWTGVLKLYD